jgi:hypothetical protein
MVAHGGVAAIDRSDELGQQRIIKMDDGETKDAKKKSRCA